VDELSAAPAAVPAVKDAIRHMRMTELRGLAEAALKAVNARKSWPYVGS